MDTRVMKCFWTFSGMLLFISQCYAAQTESIIVSTTIISRFAETSVSSSFFNDDTKPKEVEFKVLLPHEAFVTSYSLVIDGVWYYGVVEEKRKAKREFEIAKERQVAAGIFQTESTSIRTFKTRNNIEPGSQVYFYLVYQQLLRRINGKYKLEITLLGSQLTEELDIEVHICESKPVFNVTVLPILTGDGILIKPRVKIRQEYRNTASLSFFSDSNQAFVDSLLSSGGKFTLQYETESSENGELVVYNGNFLQFFAPEIVLKPRRIIFLLDISGSMKTDDKISHLKTAMNKIIWNLSEKDRFGIIAFSTDIIFWTENNKTMNWGTTKNINSAIKFITSLYVTGYTEFYDPLVKAIGLLQQDLDIIPSEAKAKWNYVVLITDGRPAVSPGAKIDKNQWLYNISAVNRNRFAIHAIGLGADVDSQVLRTLTAHNGGTWKQIFPNINTAIQIQNYLEHLEIDLLKNISLSHPDVVTSRTILPPRNMRGEYVIAGQLTESVKEDEYYHMTVTDEPGGEIRVSMEFVTKNTNLACSSVDKEVAANFTKKAHGFAMVMSVLRQIDQTRDRKLLAELKEQATILAKRHNLVTPFTSMVVLRPGDREEIQVQYSEEKKRSVFTTSAPTTTRQIPTWGLIGDPHIIVHLTNDVSACFECDGRDGEIFNFLNDKKLGIIVNGKTRKSSPGTELSKHLLITEIAIILKEENLLIMVKPREVTVQAMFLGGKRQPFLKLRTENIEDYKTNYGSITLGVRNTRDLSKIVTVYMLSGLYFQLHLKRNPVAYSRKDHIDLEVLGTNHLSFNLGGILGCFPSKFFDRSQVSVITTEKGKFMMVYRNRLIPVKRGGVRLSTFKNKLPCWHVEDESLLLGSSIDSFKVDSILHF